jgi:hypothetical protein
MSADTAQWPTPTSPGTPEGMDAARDHARERQGEDRGRAVLRRVRITRPGDIRMERPEFLKADWYPRDVVTLVAGPGGEGKSSLVLADVAAGTRGELEGDRKGTVLRSLIIAREDSQGLQRARLRAAGADEQHYGFLDMVEDVGGQDLDVAPNFVRDLPQVREALAGFCADLLVIDPISAVIPGDQNKVETIRAVLDPLTILARDLRIAVVGIMHFNKGGGRASDKLSGSHAYRDVARSVLVVAHDGDTGERVVTVDKSNYGESQGKSWTFTLESSDVLDARGETMSVPRARVTGETDVSVEQIINRGPDSFEDVGDDREDARAWLEALLLAGPGGVSAADVKRRAGKDLTCSWRTVQRAMKDLGVSTEYVGNPPCAVWSLSTLPRQGNGTTREDICHPAANPGMFPQIIDGMTRDDTQDRLSSRVIPSVTSTNALESATARHDSERVTPTVRERTDTVPDTPEGDTGQTGSIFPPCRAPGCAQDLWSPESQRLGYCSKHRYLSEGEAS